MPGERPEKRILHDARHRVSSVDLAVPDLESVKACSALIAGKQEGKAARMELANAPYGGVVYVLRRKEDLAIPFAHDVAVDRVRCRVVAERIVADQLDPAALQPISISAVAKIVDVHARHKAIVDMAQFGSCRPDREVALEGADLASVFAKEMCTIDLECDVPFSNHMPPMVHEPVLWTVDDDAVAHDVWGYIVSSALAYMEVDRISADRIAIGAVDQRTLVVDDRDRVGNASIRASQSIEPSPVYAYASLNVHDHRVTATIDAPAVFRSENDVAGQISDPYFRADGRQMSIAKRCCECDSPSTSIDLGDTHDLILIDV